MISSKCCASTSSPVPRLIARSMLSFGMLCERAVKIALRSRGFAAGSPPPVFAAMLISLESLLKRLPRFASIAPLNRLTFDHLLCPAIGVRSFDYVKNCLTKNIREPNRNGAPRDLAKRQINGNIQLHSRYFVNISVAVFARFRAVALRMRLRRRSDLGVASTN